MAQTGTTIDDRTTAARHAGVSSLVAFVVTLLALADGTTAWPAVVGVAAAHLVLGAMVWRLPSDSWTGVRGERQAVVVGVAMLVLLAATSWVFEGYASGVGPLYVLVFVWFGLHCRPWSLVAAVPVAAIGYAGSLLLTDAPTRRVLSVLILVPIATVVSLLISQHVRLQRALRRDLELRERWRGALMATLAHDVRSPLASVTGTIEVLQDDETLDPAYRPLLASAMRQSQRVLRLATGILEVERVEHGRLVLDRSRVSVAALGHQVAELTQRDDVVVDVDPGVEVVVDPERIEQVLYNLVSNALRHGRPPVVVSARQLADRVEVAVEDHGSGVPETEVPFLFDRFSSADHSPHSVGLGLWIVRTLVGAHDGEVRYEAPRGGARFVVSLPGAPAVRDAGTGAADPPEGDPKPPCSPPVTRA
ncbi:sensor histidine kinase [Nocardioides sp. T2.26MG-1]|uniref:sensor histidine kinase n=1 Tax=Nocardioides sp. T2.26MG-1 TaxID=3041166 RepID=UPI002477B1F0|nr:HAMP domain-containing sensor histidine kinase [Nocardioides sp. T2.26MG-1]CAI9412796.1 Adaptive-response sensory-kinase SasA [Nocardioides sp. T2.26MG-1]